MKLSDFSLVFYVEEYGKFGPVFEPLCTAFLLLPDKEETSDGASPYKSELGIG